MEKKALKKFEKAMITIELIKTIFNLSKMIRWKGLANPYKFSELDKQGHKMMVAYVLGKHEECSQDFHWRELIEGEFFELLERAILTDLKPSLYKEIRCDKKLFKKMTDWLISNTKLMLQPIDESILERFADYLSDAADCTVYKRILFASNIFVSNWELEYLKKVNPTHCKLCDIEIDLVSKLKDIKGLKGLDFLINNRNINEFLNFCGRLRFQNRWSHIFKVPPTSVLGHSFFVGIVSYLYSLSLKACEKRLFNNFFTGLFHDLPEIFTFDIIYPVKHSIDSLPDFIKLYEKKILNHRVYPLLPALWENDFKLFSENEFSTVIKLSSEYKNSSSIEINKNYNKDIYNPRDGSLIKAIDHLFALIESVESIRNGCFHEQLHKTIEYLIEKYKKKTIGNIDFGQIFEQIPQKWTRRI